jgi:hypothetical protein
MGQFHTFHTLPIVGTKGRSELAKPGLPPRANFYECQAIKFKKNASVSFILAPTFVYIAHVH